jgi:glutamate 5-kinase
MYLLRETATRILGEAQRRSKWQYGDLMSIANRKATARRLAEAKRVCVKVGSALLVDPDKGRLNRAWLESFAADVARMRKRGQEVILVSSGAIALGRRHLGLPAGKLRLEESQAAAAVGQIRLAHAYKELLDEHQITVAQILLTLGDTEQRRRYLNARGTLNTLLSLGAVPVINENDTVATAEIRYGDNDRLAARVAQMVGAECLVLLSDIDGLYTANPNEDPDAQFIARVLEITPAIEAMASGTVSDMGSGGMQTKIAAAKIAVGAGCHLCIAKGAHPHPLLRIEEGALCTWFVPSSTPLATRKQWIAGTLKPAGAIAVDDGAVRALLAGKSLLPAGVTRAVGRFERGDTVSIVGPDGVEVARGICAYSDSDAARIIGRKSAEIEALLGYRGRDEIVHRDDLVVLKAF